MTRQITECSRTASHEVARDTRTFIGMPRTPDPRTWDPCKVSQQYVADYKPLDCLNGPGWRSSLFVSGCLFSCPGCFNEAAWSFRFGKPYDFDLEERILADLAKPYVRGLSLLGGEPFLNTQVCLRLVERMRDELPAKDIWAWTGYTFEYLIEHGTASQRALLDALDVLVDGPFRHDLKDLTLPFRGSSNQRILNVPASLATGRPFTWETP